MKQAQKVLFSRKFRNRTLPIISTIIIALLLLLRFTGALNYSIMATPSNEPGIKTGAYVFFSSLKQPRLFDFIVFKKSENGTNSNYIGRLCGLPGDVVQLKQGALWINGISKDDVIKPYFLYEIPDDEFEIHKGVLENYDCTSRPYLFLSEELIQKNDIKGKRIIRDAPDEMTQSVFGQQWNTSNFGPFVVPNGHYFIVGDNRDNSVDSRMYGPVKISDFTGTILGH